KASEAFHAGDGAVHDDGSAVRHQRQRFLHCEQRAFDVDVDDLVEACLGNGSNGNVEFADAGAGEENIDPALLGFNFCVQAIEIRETSGISLHSGDVPADLLDRLVELFLAPASYEYICALFDEEFRRGQGHAGCRPGDDRNFAIELSHWAFSSSYRFLMDGQIADQSA